MGVLIGTLVVLAIIYFIAQPKVIAYQKEVERVKYYQSGIDLMKQEKWLEAREIFSKVLPTYKFFKTPYVDKEEARYKESQILYEYAYAKSRYDADREDSWTTLKLFVPENYNGAFADDIKAFRKQLESDPIIQKAIKVEAARYAAAVNAWAVAANTPAAPKDPKIGMTANEVLASTWGTPKSKNRTTYAFGVKEQWVYSSNRYIYLLDGIVDAIQD